MKRAHERSSQDLAQQDDRVVISDGASPRRGSANSTQDIRRISASHSDCDPKHGAELHRARYPGSCRGHQAVAPAADQFLPGRRRQRHPRRLDAARRYLGELPGQLETGSPYARQTRLQALTAMNALYRQDRALTDRLFADLDISKISIENSRQQWALYDDIIDRDVDEPEYNVVPPPMSSGLTRSPPARTSGSSRPDC